jgi:arylsulfatase A-like enzyme
MAAWRRSPALVGACVLAGAGAACLLVFAPAPRPNVLLISIDTLRADRLGCYGGNVDEGRTLARLAASAHIFSAAYTPRGETAPSLASLMTGLNPSRHGVLRNDCRMREDTPTLPRLLASAGYETAAFVSNRVVPIAKLDRDFARSRCTHKEGAPQWQWDEDTVAAAREFLSAPRERPFFAWVHLMDPHSPYQAAPADRGKFAKGTLGLDGSREQLEKFTRGEEPCDAKDLAEVRALYDEEVAGSARRVGEILRALDATGLSATTLVIVVADHGEELGDRQRYFFHSLSVHRPVVRVPFIWRAPGARPKPVAAEARGIDTPVSLIDILPTLAARLALPLAHEVDGVDLAPLLEGRRLARDAVFTEYENAIAGVFTANYHYIHNPDGVTLPIGAAAALEGEAARAGGAPIRLKVARAELYDVLADPTEQKNLAEERPGECAELLARIAAYLASRRMVEPDVIIDEAVRQELKGLGYL